MNDDCAEVHVLYAQVNDPTDRLSFGIPMLTNCALLLAWLFL